MSDTRHLELNETWIDGETKWTAAIARRVVRALDSQTFGALQALIQNGGGVLAIPDDTSFNVSAGAGFSVNIATGAAIAPHPTYDAVFLQTRATTNLAGLTPSATVYIHATIETSGTNDSRETAVPLFIASDLDTLDGAVLVAEVVVGVAGITSVTDRRSFISFATGSGSAFNFRGAWDSATNYEADDAVSDQGSSWLALRANTNVEPVEGDDWTLLAQKGDDGAAGAQGPAGADGTDGGIVSTLARADATATTSTLADGASADASISLGRISILIRVSTDVPARVRLYRTMAQRAADAARPIGTRPVGNHGLIWEGVTTVGTLSIDVLRELLAVNAESPPVATMALSVTNLSGASNAVTVTINRSTVQE